MELQPLVQPLTSETVSWGEGGHHRQKNTEFYPICKNLVLTTESVSQVLYFAQIASAVGAKGLSFWRLANRNFYDDGNSGPNVDVSMNVFYVLAVVEGGLFLLEKGYLEYRIKHQTLLDEVCEHDYIGSKNLIIVKHFFYHVYAELLKESVFAMLDMNLV